LGLTTTIWKSCSAQAGQVHGAAVIMDEFSGQSKGFGYVEMSNAEEAGKPWCSLMIASFKVETSQCNEASRANRALAAGAGMAVAARRERQSLVDAVSGAGVNPLQAFSRPHRANQSRPSAFDDGLIEDDLKLLFPRSGPSFHYYDLGDGEAEGVC
jgi:hypothetical protein